MSKRRFRFTKSAIDELATTEAEVGSVGYVIYWDTQVIGLGIQVRPSGVKTFVFSYRTRQGRSRRLTLGRYGRITLDQAREAAKAKNGVVSNGGDPASDKARDRCSKTLDQLFAAYIEEHIIPNCSENTVRSVNRVRKLILRGIGNEFINEIKSADVRVFLNQFKSKPGNYNLVRTYIGAAWTWAHKFGFGELDENARNVVEEIDTIPSTSRARMVSEAEYQAVLKAIDELIEERRNDPSRLLACLFVIATGCRPIEAVRLRCADVDYERGAIKLTEHKLFNRTRQPKYFYITALLKEILERAEALRDLRRVESKFVFPRRGNQKPSNWLAKTWKSIRSRADVDMELRQFRTGYINLCDELGMNDNEIAEITQHASTGTIKRHYRVMKEKRGRVNADIVDQRLQKLRNLAF